MSQSYLRLYATMYHVFALIDGMGEGVTKDDDRKLSLEEWKQALPQVKEAGASWAPFVALQNASEDDFATMDADGGGSVWLVEFCEWIDNEEKKANTATGMELGIGDE